MEDTRQGARVAEAVAGRELLLRVLPYGEEALLIDSARLCSEGEVEGQRMVTVADCAGHFDTNRGYPLVLPGAKLFEMLGQTAAYGILSQAEHQRKIFIFSTFQGSVEAPVVPGDLLKLHVWLLDRRARGVARIERGEVSRVEWKFHVVAPKLLFRLVRRSP